MTMPMFSFHPSILAGIILAGWLGAYWLVRFSGPLHARERAVRSTGAHSAATALRVVVAVCGLGAALYLAGALRGPRLVVLNSRLRVGDSRPPADLVAALAGRTAADLGGYRDAVLSDLASRPECLSLGWRDSCREALARSLRRQAPYMFWGLPASGVRPPLSDLPLDLVRGVEATLVQLAITFGAREVLIGAVAPDLREDQFWGVQEHLYRTAGARASLRVFNTPRGTGLAVVRISNALLHPERDGERVMTFWAVISGGSAGREVVRFDVQRRGVVVSSCDIVLEEADAPVTPRRLARGRCAVPASLALDDLEVHARTRPGASATVRAIEPPLAVVSGPSAAEWVTAWTTVFDRSFREALRTHLSALDDSTTSTPESSGSRTNAIDLAIDLWSRSLRVPEMGSGVCTGERCAAVFVDDDMLVVATPSRLDGAVTAARERRLSTADVREVRVDRCAGMPRTVYSLFGQGLFVTPSRYQSVDDLVSACPIGMPCEEPGRGSLRVPVLTRLPNPSGALSGGSATVLWLRSPAGSLLPFGGVEPRQGAAGLDDTDPAIGTGVAATVAWAVERALGDASALQESQPPLTTPVFDRDATEAVEAHATRNTDLVASAVLLVALLSALNVARSRRGASA